MEEIKDDLTYKIIGCAMKVHSTLGNGFQEVIYQRCLAIEFEKAGLAFIREADQPIFYDGIAVGTRRADFIVEEKVLVEIKATITLEDVHLAQVKNYQVAYNFDIGLLLNFGSESLEYKRIYHPRLKNPTHPKIYKS
jgi:GxxExxY protein